MFDKNICTLFWPPQSGINSYFRGNENTMSVSQMIRECTHRYSSYINLSDFDFCSSGRIDASEAVDLTFG